MGGPEVIVTERLRGERIGPQHVEMLLRIFSDPRVGATMGGVMSAEVVAQQLAHVDAAWERDGFGYWMFFETATGAPLARGGLQRSEFDGTPEVEVAWTTAPDRWGEGFATELGAASVEFGFEQLGLADVVAFTLPANRASLRVMQKLGFEYEREIEHAGLPHVLYRLTTAAG